MAGKEGEEKNGHRKGNNDNPELEAAGLLSDLKLAMSFRFWEKDDTAIAAGYAKISFSVLDRGYLLSLLVLLPIPTRMRRP